METAQPRRIVNLLVGAAILVPRPVTADEAVLEPVKVTAEAPEPPPSPGLETVQSDTVEIGEESAGTWLTLEDVLESMPSVRVRSFGAPGSPSFLSVRGTDSTHTLVMLDGVPLNDASTGFVDLSTIPVSVLGSATVIRGGHEAGAGPYHPGGVVLLESLEPEPGLHAGGSLTLGLYPLGPGSGTGDSAKLVLRPAREVLRFGAQRKLTLWESWFGGSFGILATGSFTSGAGDFAYLSDNGTVYNLDDDHYLQRKNSGHDATSALLKMTWIPDALSQLVLGGVLHAAADGLPGIDVLPTTLSRLERTRGNLSLSYRRWSEDLLSVPSLMASGFLRYTSVGFRDLLGEIALSATDTVSSDILGGLTLEGHGLERGGTVLGGSFEFTIEGWKSHDRLAGETAIRALRLGVGLGTDLSVPLLSSIVILEASARATLLHDRTITSDEGNTEIYLSPRAGLKVSPLPWLHVLASVAYTHRPASFMELFGSGGVFRGSPDLEPEHGVSSDAGVMVSLPPGVAGALEMSARASVFLGHVQDLIVFIQNSQKTMVARNVDEARLRGLEITAGVGWSGWASVELGYTLLDPVDRSGIEPYDGLMMPNRPRHDLYLEASLGHWGVEITYLLDNVSGGYVDRANLDPISTRTIHTLGLRWTPAFAKGLSLDLKWWNMGNEHVDTSRIVSSTGESFTRRRALADVDGYPLPGTALFLTLAYRR